MKRWWLVVTAFAVVLGGPALAQDDIDCAKAEVQAEMNACAEQDFETADAALNEQWSAARSAAKDLDGDQDAADTGAAKALLAGQRGWIAYRDGQCEAEGFSAQGGTMEPLLAAECKTRMTEARTKELRAFVGGGEQQ